MVRRLLEIDCRTRGNDTLLQMKVLEREGLIKRFNQTRYGPGWFIRESDILSGKISSSVMETIRRARQKIQEHGKLLPTDIVVEQRLKASEDISSQIKSIESKEEYK